MTTETLTRPAITPFQSRIFRTSGKFLPSEINEFQAQSWGLGDSPIHFQICLSDKPVARRLGAFFQNLPKIEPEAQPFVRSFRKSPSFSSSGVKGSLVLASMSDSQAARPLAMCSLSIDLLPSTKEENCHLFSIDIDAIYMSAGAQQAENMICAGLSDILFDELSLMQYQAAGSGVQGKMHVLLRSSAESSPVTNVVKKMQGEFDGVRHLLNHRSVQNAPAPLRFLPAR